MLKCPVCGFEVEANPYSIRCPRCGQLLDAVLQVELVGDFDFKGLRGFGVWRYERLLPKPKVRVSLREGGTPLVRLRGFKDVYVKFEGANPTGSFKDRGMTVGVSIAASIGARGVIVASTGNTAASAAAYSARAGLDCIVVLPKGGVAKGKLVQAILHGARILEVEGTFDKALEFVLESVLSNGIVVSGVAYYPLNSINPWRLEGQKTIAFEIVEEIGVPDYVFVPVGNGGNIFAIWKGFTELYRLGVVDKVPVMVGVQAEGSAPLVRYWLGLGGPMVDNPTTIASAIRIGRPVNWHRAYRAVRESGGLFLAVSDDEILQAQRMLGREGIGVEPASAASLAGYLKAVENGIIDRDARVVLIATGHALKDPDVLFKHEAERRVVGSIEELKRLLLG